MSLSNSIISDFSDKNIIVVNKEDIDDEGNIITDDNGEIVQYGVLYVSVYFNTKARNFNKAKYIKICFIPKVLSDSPIIHLKESVIYNNVKIDYNNFETYNKNNVQSKFYSQNIISDYEQQKNYNYFTISKEENEIITQNVYELNFGTVKRLTKPHDKGFIVNLYVLNSNKEILEYKNLSYDNNIATDYFKSSLPESYRKALLKNVSLTFNTNYEIVNRIFNNGPSLNGYNGLNISSIKFSIDNFNVVVEENDFPELHLKLLDTYENNIFKYLYTKINNEKLNEVEIAYTIYSETISATKIISIQKNIIISIYNSFLLKFKKEYIIENFTGKYTQSYLQSDQVFNVYKHNFNKLSDEFRQSYIMSNIKNIEIEYYNIPNGRFLLCYDDTLNFYNSLGSISKSLNKETYLLDVLFNNLILYSKKEIKTIICDNIIVYPELLEEVEDNQNSSLSTPGIIFERNQIPNNFEVYRKASEAIIETIIDDSGVLNPVVLDKHSEIFSQLGYDTSSSIWREKVFENTIIKNSVIDKENLTERVTFQKLSTNLNKPLETSTYTVRSYNNNNNNTNIFNFIVFNEGSILNLENNNLSDQDKENFISCLYAFSPNKFANICSLFERQSKPKYENFFSIVSENISSYTKKENKIIDNDQNIFEQQITNQSNVLKEYNNVSTNIKNIPKKYINALLSYENTVDLEFVDFNTELVFNSSLNIELLNKSKNYIISIDASFFEDLENLHFEAFYHTNIEYYSNYFKESKNNIVNSSYLIDNEFLKVKDNVIVKKDKEKITFSIDSYINNFNKNYYLKCKEIWSNENKLKIKSIKQNLLIIAKSNKEEKIYLACSHIEPSYLLKNKFNIKHANSLNIDIKEIKNSNIAISVN